MYLFADGAGGLSQDGPRLPRMDCRFREPLLMEATEQQGHSKSQHALTHRKLVSNGNHRGPVRQSCLDGKCRGYLPALQKQPRLLLVEKTFVCRASHGISTLPKHRFHRLLQRLGVNVCLCQVWLDLILKDSF